MLPVLRFTHFTRHGYALFAVVGKVVLIGVLSVSTLKYAKANSLSIEVEFANDSLKREEIKLDEIVVTGSYVPLSDIEASKMVVVVSREDISHATSTVSVNDILKNIAGVDVRQRGAYGVQTDISMRGGNFDQMTFLLNGVNVSSPHTGHLSADFPLSEDDIERIEIIKGAASRAYGANSLNGIINIVTRHSGDYIMGNISGGSYGYVNANTNLFGKTQQISGFASAGYSRSDGATENSAFSSARFFLRGTAKFGCARLSTQASYSFKPFEANTFYGAGSTNQWESNERFSVAISADIQLRKIHLMSQVYWNRWLDHYQWHKDSPSGENYHLVDTYAIVLSGWLESKIGRTSMGIEMQRETIYSTSLGKELNPDKYRHTIGIGSNCDVKYDHFDDRNIPSVFLEHSVLFATWTFSADLNVIHSPFKHWSCCPGADISYRPNDNCRLFFSWNMAMRMPTFTDLYYSGTNIEGNRRLLPEQTMDFSFGTSWQVCRGIKTEIELFYSNKKNMIDWVIYSEADDETFHSVNFKMHNFGADICLSIAPQTLLGISFPIREIAVKYSYIHEKSHYGITIVQSKYAMEYLRNKFVVSCHGHLWKDLNFSLAYRWHDRVGSDNVDYGLLDGKLSWDTRNYSIFINANNILNHRYYDYLTIPQPRLTIVGGVKLAF